MKKNTPSSNAEIDFKSIVHFLHSEGARGSEIYERLVAVYGDSAVSQKTVYRWLEEIANGTFQVTHRLGAGRPSTSVNNDIIRIVDGMVTEDPRTTYAEIEEWLGIAAPQVHRILHEFLGYSKICARWVPKLLTTEMRSRRKSTCQELLQHLHRNMPDLLEKMITLDETWFHYYCPETKQQSMEWHRPGDPPPLKPKSTASAGKRMATVCWDYQGIVLLEWLEEGRTVNGTYFCQLLEHLRSAIKEKRWGRLSQGVMILMDNAPAHTAAITQEKMKDLGFSALPHPAYSPDLAPSDYWLFPAMKKPLRGKRYHTLQELATALSKWESNTPQEWFAAGIQKLQERWQKCVSLDGGYIEKEDTEWTLSVNVSFVENKKCH